MRPGRISRCLRRKEMRLGSISRRPRRKAMRSGSIIERTWMRSGSISTYLESITGDREIIVDAVAAEIIDDTEEVDDGKIDELYVGMKKSSRAATKGLDSCANNMEVEKELVATTDCCSLKAKTAARSAIVTLHREEMRLSRITKHLDAPGHISRCLRRKEMRLSRITEHLDAPEEHL
ncbi:hypothetical protein RHMOL_Rhmol05G0256100 [Rhododendron molle]|uniref:Uncharacterized protein n=1 Tax=Rhododendron molle TaxID=49168 RepID=A0ACC0NTF1_RHOML|nr:hypothetical protein RHMOL_Rhmol05G0256100 [Rhododendron molle]